MGIIYRLLLLVLFIMPSLSVSYAQETESASVSAEAVQAEQVQAEQVQAGRIATEITKALEGEPFTVEQSCDQGNCVITLQMK